jgi:hypothetical protein
VNWKRLWWSLSNLAYPAFGLMVGEPVFLALMTGLGIASAIYHWNFQRNADWDVGMIYVILLFLIGVGWGLPPIVAALPALPAGWALRKKVTALNMEEKVAILIGPMIVFGFLTGAALLHAVVILAVALAVRQWVDHGAWHPVSAAGLALVAQALLK